MKRAVIAIKRGFGTASTGPTRKLLNIIAKHVGYNDFGFPYSSRSEVELYLPKAAAGDYLEVCDTLEAMMRFTAGGQGAAYRNEERLMFQHAASLNSDKRTALRIFMKDQAARWMIYRQPMLDFLGDSQREIVWSFDSDYRKERT